MSLSLFTESHSHYIYFILFIYFVQPFISLTVPLIMSGIIIIDAVYTSCEVRASSDQLVEEHGLVFIPRRYHTLAAQHWTSRRRQQVRRPNELVPWTLSNVIARWRNAMACVDHHAMITAGCQQKKKQNKCLRVFILQCSTYRLVWNHVHVHGRLMSYKQLVVVF